MIMGFIIHFYITFGTNLLTGGPAHIAVLLHVSVFRRKGISNEVQTEGNLRQHDFLEEYDPRELEFTSEDPRGSHEIGGRAPRSACPCLVGPSRLPRPTSFTYISLRTLNHRISRYIGSSAATSICSHQKPLGSPFRHLSGGVIHHRWPSSSSRCSP